MPDRTLRLIALAACTAALTVGAAGTAAAATTVREAEALALPAAAGTSFADTAASGGRGLLVWSNGTATGSVVTTAARRVVVRARGDQCEGAPRMTVAVDGRRVLDAAVSSSSWADYGVEL